MLQKLLLFFCCASLATAVGVAIDAPVLMLKRCIVNRSLGWELLPPASERYQADVPEKL
jgi:hypothetical protein